MLPLFLLVPLFPVHSEGPFYTTCRKGFLLFYPLTAFVWVWVSFQTTHWSINCPLTYAGHATSHYQTKSLILFACSLWHSHPDKGRHSLSLSLTACTSWFQLIFPSFGWYVIPAKYFPQKSLNENPKIGLPLLPTIRPHPLLPLTHGPPLLYWLGTSWWCLSLMCAPLSCVSMACLLLTHFP